MQRGNVFVVDETTRPGLRSGRGNEAGCYWFGLFEVEVEVEVEVDEATITARTKKRNRASRPNFAKGLARYPEAPPPAKAVQGLEPDDRNRFCALPNLVQLSLPSSLSRRSAQLKATKRRISSCSPQLNQCHPLTASYCLTQSVPPTYCLTQSVPPTYCLTLSLTGGRMVTTGD